MATRRKSPKSRTKREAKKPAKYVVTATFKKMVSIPLSKSVADKLAKDVRKQGGSATIKKV